MDEAVTYFITWTTYGTWLPGDMRGYVEGGQILPGNPSLLDYAKQRLAKSPVYFTATEQDAVYEALVNASGEFDYLLTDVSLESWHVHWICSHGDDPIPKMVGRLNSQVGTPIIWPTKRNCNVWAESAAWLGTRS